MSDMDKFVEKVLLHNRIITRAQLDEARRLAAEYEGSTLLDGLINAGALDAAHARGIFEDYNRWLETRKAQGNRGTQQMPTAQAEQPAPAPTQEMPEQHQAAPARSEPLRGHGGPTRARPRPPGRAGRFSKAPEGPYDSLDDYEDDDSAELSMEMDVRTAAVQSRTDDPNAQYLNQLLQHARQMGASDLHIKTGVPPVVRKHGQLLHFQTEPFREGQTEAILTSILNEEQKAQLANEKVIEFSYAIDAQGRYRCILVQQRTGIDGAFRILQSKIMSFEDLGLPAHLTRLGEYHQGLVLVTGPGGAGKSTTLAALIEMVNQSREDHIITIEDPIEYEYTPRYAQINQREVGLHTVDFPTALKSAFREDPDVMMIGELRDRETMSLAVTAAETGHLVFGTMDTTSAPRTIDRILEVFPPAEQGQVRSMISESLRGIVCQQLIPRKDGGGRVMALEIMFNTSGVSNLIRDNKIQQIPALMQMGRNQGMMLMDNHLQHLVDTDAIEGVEAWFAAVDKSRFATYAPMGG